MKDELKALLGDDLAKKLEDAKINDAAVEILIAQELTTVEALRGFTYQQFLDLKVKAGPARILEGLFKVVPVAETPSPTSTVSMDVLPTVPDDTSFLEMLKVGGILKIQTVDVISAMRAAIASVVGLYDLPDKLIAQMEKFALEQEEPLGESFYRLQKLITTRSYGDILAAMGVSGTFVSERRKKEVLERLNSQLWPALRGFQDQLKAWVETWNQTGSNPGMLLQALALGMSGQKGIMPPGMMMQPPDTAGLHDEAEAVINKINKVFAGVGIPVARALGSDAVRIREVLEEPTLPTAVGAATKDQMLKTLGINVGADYIRLERNIIRFALAIMELPKVTSGNDEYTYLGAMLQLGAAIPWDKLQATAAVDSRKGGARADGSRAMFREDETR
jgi:hypothetical protein